MRKQKKLNNQWRNKIRGLKIGDNVLVDVLVETEERQQYDGILDEIGDGYIVVNKIIIERKELMNINKIK
jgi:ERCC4-type nuclease